MHRASGVSLLCCLVVVASGASGALGGAAGATGAVGSAAGAAAVSGDATGTTGATADAADEIVVEPGESIQAAVDRASPGDTVRVESGTYEQRVVVNESVTLTSPDGATLDGGAVVVAADGVTVSGFTVRDGGTGVETDGRVDGLELRNLTVENTGEYGLDLAVESVTVADVEATDNGDTGIKIGSTESGAVSVTDVTVEGSTGGYQDTGRGLRVRGGETVTVDGADVSGTASVGIRVVSGDASDQNVSIRNTRVTEAGENGITVGGSGSNVPAAVTVANATTSNNADSGVAVTGDDVTVRGVDSTDDGDTGVEISASDGGAVAVTDVSAVRSAAGYQDQGYGVQVTGGAEVVATDVSTRATGGTGLRIAAGGAPSQGVRLRDVEALNAGGDGVGVYGADSSSEVNATVRRVESSDNAENGLHVEATAVTVESVLAEDNGDTGVSLRPTPSGTATATNVTVRRSAEGYQDAGHGVSVTGGSAVTLSGIDAVGNGGRGVAVQGGDARGQSVTLSAVDAEKSGGVGVFVGGTGGEDAVELADVESETSGGRGLSVSGDEVRADNVTALDSGDTGLYVDPSASGTVALSNVTAERSTSGYRKNGHGVLVAGGATVTVTDALAASNDGANLRVDADEARGQEIRIERATLEGAGGDGLYVPGSDGSDGVVVRDSVATGNGGAGFDLDSIESVEIRGARGSNNADGNLKLGAIDRSEATIVNSFADYGSSAGTTAANAGSGNGGDGGGSGSTGDGGLPVPTWVLVAAVLVPLAYATRGVLAGVTSSSDDSASRRVPDSGTKRTQSTDPSGSSDRGSQSGTDASDADSGDDHSDRGGSADPSGPGPSQSDSAEPTGSPVDWSRAPETVPGAPALSMDYADLTDEERIGSGGNADVSRATHAPSGETVAVKEPRVDGTLTADWDALGGFLDEAETWSKLDDHEGVVGVVDWGERPAPWIAMEYMDGGDLVARAGALPFDQALWTALAVTDAVVHAHERGVAHLDLKPENVLFRSVDGAWDAPKVADWGLSKHLLENSQTVEGLTPQYAAPEQFDAEEFGPVDHVTDVYGLGAVCYELFTGRPPFEGGAASLVKDVLYEEPTPPSEVADVPPELDAVLLRALAKRKADRYESVYYFRDALRALGEDRG